MSTVRNPLDAIALVASSDKEHAWKLITGFSDLMDSTLIAAAFDYQALDSDTRDLIQQKTGEIKALARRAAEDIITIGYALIEVKANLKHGQFGAWLQAEFGWQERTAQGFMQVARRFGKSAIIADLNLAPTVLGMLAAPSTPDPAIAEAISLLQSGKKVDTHTARDIIRRHKDAEEAAAIDLIIETAPGGKVANALETTHLKAVVGVAETIAVTGTVNGATPLADALKPHVVQAQYEAMKRQEEYADAKQEAKRARQLERHLAKEQAPLGWDASKAWKLIETPIERAHETLDAESVDWIVTDPPYGAEHLPLYGALARLAAHVLKPGGGLLCMTGQSVLPQVMAALGERLNYHWVVSYNTPGGQSAQLWRQRVNTFWKPVLWYVNGDYAGDWIGDVVTSETNEKNMHHWQQSESGMRDLMRRFVYPNQVILDPFTGASTTGVVALRLRCQYIGIDNDPAVLSVSKERLTKCTHQTA